MHINIEKLKERMSGSEELVQIFLKRLESGVIENLQGEAHQLLQQHCRDENKVRAFAHTLKGAARTACFDGLERLAMAIENLDVWNEGQAKALLQDVVKEIEAIHTVLKRLQSG